METLKILSYTDEKYTQEHLGALSFPMNPDSLKFGKGIIYKEDKQLGSINGSNSFEQYKPETLTFDFIIDSTGVIEGIPLRAEVKLEFSGFRGAEEDKKRFSKMSPDMSRLIIIKESDTLATLTLCHQIIYENSLLATEVARFNSLNGLRGIPAGTEILFPPLKKN